MSPPLLIDSPLVTTIDTADYGQPLHKLVYLQKVLQHVLRSSLTYVEPPYKMFVHELSKPFYFCGSLQLQRYKLLYLSLLTDSVTATNHDNLPQFIDIALNMKNHLFCPYQTWVSSQLLRVAGRPSARHWIYFPTIDKRSDYYASSIKNQ